MSITEYDLLLLPIVKVIYAMLLGGFMGLERELAKKPAGLRTHMLVTGSAALLVVLGDIMISKYSGAAVVDAIQADPIRIMEAIITGISFLGAGTIIFRDKEETVEGLTTAASILFASAIGITVALEQFLLAGILTVIAIAILLGLGYIERFTSWLRRNVYEKNSKD